MAFTERVICTYLCGVGRIYAGGYFTHNGNLTQDENLQSQTVLGVHEAYLLLTQ